MTPRTVPLYCDRAPVPWQVAAVRETAVIHNPVSFVARDVWRCSWCGARVKVVA